MLSTHNKDWQWGEKRFLRHEKESGYSLAVLYQPPGSSEKKGSEPMSIGWRLDAEIPAWFMRKAGKGIS